MKSIVVIGGSHGIGWEITRQLLSQGDRVTVLSRTPGQLAELADGAHGLNHITCDVTQDEIDATSLPEVMDGLVYCPGSINLRAIGSLPLQQFRDDFELNLVGGVKAVQASLRGLKAASSASIVFFSTVAVRQGMFAHASIAAAKGAVEGLTRTLAAELAPTIRVNCLAPALTETPLAARFFSKPEKVEALAKMYPLARTGKPEDLASIACFLLSDASSWMTGQIIGVDGGMSAVRN
ncbi:MAG: SDR family oxidoreductase [bacterium]|nr:SDR family oxidoreductase [bacterium]